jgi:hypothetical protein
MAMNIIQMKFGTTGKIAPAYKVSAFNIIAVPGTSVKVYNNPI